MQEVVKERMFLQIFKVIYYMVTDFLDVAIRNPKLGFTGGAEH